MHFCRLPVLAFLFLFALPAVSQKTKAALEKERLKLQNEISQISQLLGEQQNEKRTVLDQVSEIQKKISLRQRIISLGKKENQVLTNRINSNIQKISNLHDELSGLKRDYAQMIRKSYKGRSNQSRLMFFLSSSNFLGAWKKWQYLKQYNYHRKKQGLDIEEKTLSLSQINTQLIKERKEKKQLQSETEKEQSTLKTERLVQKELLRFIRSNESKYKGQISQKQKQTRFIDQQIERLIKRAIARSNKNLSGSAAGSFALTAEDRLIGNNFKSNKGKLPWPVERGRLTVRYGRQPHPVVKSVFIQSNGVRIETEKNAVARAIFNGTVLAVQLIKGGNKAVLVQHGNYISVYNNLSRVFVGEGQQVGTKEAIGQIHTSKTTGETLLKFSLFENSKLRDPSQWIYKM